MNAPNVTCLQGMKIPAPEAAKFGLILEAVPDDALESRAIELARRIARVPSNQLYMLKLSCNQTAENMGLGSARLLTTIFDGVARHTQEGLDFVARRNKSAFGRRYANEIDPSATMVKAHEEDEKARNKARSF